MDPLANTQIGLDGKRHPIGDPALHVHPNRPDAKPPLVVDPSQDVGRPLGPGEMADPRVSPAEIADVASGLPIVEGAAAPEPESGPATQVAPGRYDPRLYPAATTLAEAELIAAAKAEDAYPTPAGIEPDSTPEADEPTGDDEGQGDGEGEPAAGSAGDNPNPDAASSSADPDNEGKVEGGEPAEGESDGVGNADPDGEGAGESGAAASAGETPNPDAASSSADPDNDGKVEGGEPADDQVDVMSLKTHKDLDEAAAKLDPPFEFESGAKVAEKQAALVAEIERRSATPA